MITTLKTKETKPDFENVTSREKSVTRRLSITDSMGFLVPIRETLTGTEFVRSESEMSMA